MKIVFSLIIFFSCIQTIKAQPRMDEGCLDRIHELSKTITFPRSENIITLFRDTVHYGKSIISLSDVPEEFRGIFVTGLVFPKLILAASTRGNGEFKMDTLSSDDSLSVSSVREIKTATENSNTKAFSFLLWRKGLVNPSLYIIELSGKITDGGTEQFIRYSKLISFGFCSILI